MEGFATVEEALEELRNGKLILVTDDEDRENEGRFYLRCGICHNRKYQFYGNACQRAYLYADVCRICKKASFSADGRNEYRQP